MKDERLDRIILSTEDAERIFEWRDNNKELVRNCKPVLDKGVIVVGESQKVYFTVEGNTLHLTVKFIKSGKILFEVSWNMLNRKGVVIENKIFEDNKEYEHEYTKSLISLYASLMAYMEYYGDKKEYVEAKKNFVARSGKNKKSKKSKSSNKIKISRTVYKVSVNDNVASTSEKRVYERKAEAWNVRGHYRTYKSGKKVWIKPSKRGKGKEVSGKDYTL